MPRQSPPAEQLALFSSPEKPKRLYSFYPERGPDGDFIYSIWADGVLQIRNRDGRLVDAPPELQRPYPHRQTRRAR